MIVLYLMTIYSLKIKYYVLDLTKNPEYTSLPFEALLFILVESPIFLAELNISVTKALNLVTKECLSPNLSLKFSMIENFVSN